MLILPQKFRNSCSVIDGPDAAPSLARRSNIHRFHAPINQQSNRNKAARFLTFVSQSASAPSTGDLDSTMSAIINHLRY